MHDALSDFTRALARRTPDVSTPRGRAVRVYAGLVRARVAGVASSVLPRTAACLGTPRLERIASAFVADGAARSPVLRALAGELVGYMSEHPQLLAGVPAHVLPLARYELLRFNIANEDRADLPGVALAAERAVRFQAAAGLFGSAYSVHEHVVEPRASELLVYRDARDFRLCTLVLSPLAAELLRALWGGSTLSAALLALTGEYPETRPACAELLADLAERGVLLGAA